MKRPTSVTVFGILSVLFGLGGLVGIINSLIMLFSAGSSSSNPVIDLMIKNPTYGTWMKVTSLLGLIPCVTLVGAGIGLLRFREWGRKLSIIYAVYAIVSGVVGIAGNFRFLVQPMLQEAAQKQGSESAMMIAIVASTMIGSIIGLIYPILLLVFMTRPKMKAAFVPAAPPPLPGAVIP